MYSLTRAWIDSQLARMQIGVRKVGQQDEKQRDAVDAHLVADEPRPASAFSTNWKPRGRPSNFAHSSSDSAKVDQVTISATCARCAATVASVAAHRQDEQRAHQRQEGTGC